MSRSPADLKFGQKFGRCVDNGNLSVRGHSSGRMRLDKSGNRGRIPCRRRLEVQQQKGGEKRSGGRFTGLDGLSFLLAKLHSHGALQPDDPNASDILHGPDQLGKREWCVTWDRTIVRGSTMHSESCWVVRLCVQSNQYTAKENL